MLNRIFFLNTDGVPLSLTYFVQYNTFGSARQTNVKSNNDSKFMRTCAKKQVGQGKKFTLLLTNYLSNDNGQENLLW